MKALILAGGMGTRLRPLTCSHPKQLLPLADSTLIGYLLDQFKTAGINEVILATGQNSQHLQTALGDGAKHDVTLHYSIETHPLGTAGAIKQAEPFLRENAQFLVMNGDIISDIPFNHLIQYHKQHQAKATIALYRVEDPSRFGVVDITTDGQIQRFVEKPPREKAPSNLINAGCYVLDHTILDQIPAHQEVSIEYDVFPNLCQSAPVFGWEHHGFWIDIGTPASFLEAHHIFRHKVHKTPAIGSETKITSPQQISSEVTIGNRVTIGANTHISNSVIFDEAIIGEGVFIDQSIVGYGAKIGQGIKLDAHTIVGDEAILDPGAIIPSGSLICPQYRVEKDCKPPYCFVKNLKSL